MKKITKDNYQQENIDACFTENILVCTGHGVSCLAKSEKYKAFKVPANTTLSFYTHLGVKYGVDTGGMSIIENDLLPRYLDQGEVTEARDYWLNTKKNTIYFFQSGDSSLIDNKYALFLQSPDSLTVLNPRKRGASQIRCTSKDKFMSINTILEVFQGYNIHWSACTTLSKGISTTAIEDKVIENTDFKEHARVLRRYDWSDMMEVLERIK